MSKTQPRSAQLQAGPSRPRKSSTSPAHRLERGAAAHPAPSKAELGAHRVPQHPRPPPTHEEIAQRAYEIWEQGGCLPGRASDDWLRAERELWAACTEASAEQR